MSSFHYNITSKERVLLRLLLTAVRSTALLVDTNFAESPSSWETQHRRPGHSVETSGDLLKTWTLARDQEETWRLGGDVSRTRAIFPLRRCCSCVVLAAGQQLSQPRPAHRRLSIENYLIHDVSCLPTSASALSQGTNISTFYFLLHILSFLTILILLWEFSNIYIDTKSQINNHSNPISH